MKLIISIYYNHSYLSVGQCKADYFMFEDMQEKVNVVELNNFLYLKELCHEINLKVYNNK